MNAAEYILRRLYVMHGIPCFVYNAEGLCIYHTSAIDDKTDSQCIMPDQYAYFLKATQESGKPQVIRVYDVIQYGAFWGKDERLYIFGPIATRRPSYEIISKFCFKHDIEIKNLILPVKDSLQLLNALAIANWSVNGEMVTEDQIMIHSAKHSEAITLSEKDIHAYRFSKAENERRHLNYEFEREHFSKIREGDVSYLEKFEYNRMSLKQQVGALTRDERKQMEYMGVANLTLLCRAAIAGGMDPAEAYELSESYLQKLDTCSQNEHSISRLLREAQKTYVTRIHEIKQHKSNNYVEQCKSILSRNVYQPISVEEIAKEIGVDRSYLSRLFTKETGMTITRFGIKMKIEAAKSMLRYSNYSIAMIAEYLHFSSQSHMGKEFKKELGMTPAEYRKINKVNDFAQSHKSDG